MKYRSLFISDTHLGSTAAQVEPLVEYLSIHSFENIYIVGDFIDFWALKRRVRGWTPSHNRLIQAILEKSTNGAKVYWITGNHDESAEQFSGFFMCGVGIVKEVVHVAADGRRYLVIHGHQMDAVMRYAAWLSHVGSWLYDALVSVNRKFNWIRRFLGLRYWSLSQYVKSRVKTAVNFVSDFEVGITGMAKSQGLDGVIAGHIHVPADREINGVRYLNCGDHCENLSLIVEHPDGRMELVPTIAQ